LAAADEAEARAPTIKDPTARSCLEAKARSAREQARRLSTSAAKAVVARTQVVAATCAGAAERRLQDITFAVVLIDEAAQATEPSSLVPLTRGASCAVLAGDHKQLPPTVVSRQAVQQGLDVPLFERLQSTGMQPLSIQHVPGQHGFPTYTQAWNRCCWTCSIGATQALPCSPQARFMADV
jgi:hypothetical protein